MTRLGIYLTKADGSKQLFSREKVVRTCLRMGANPQLADAVAQKVESRIYDGMPTAKVLQLIFLFMRKDRPGLRHFFDLRKGLSRMDSKPEFEAFVRVVLRHQGFDVESNQILKGRCVEHEIDAIARKDGVTYFVEAKHHQSFHALTGLDESRIARAVLEDVSEGYQLGLSGVRVDKAMIVTNTRYSEHAIRYGKCRDITQVGWNYPLNGGLDDMIHGKRLHPLSCLKGLQRDDRLRLLDSGFVLITDLANESPESLVRKVGLGRRTAEELLEIAQHISNTLDESGGR